MGITYGDYLIDSGYYDITPEQERALDEQAAQERESEAREECERRGIDPNELCADGGVETWMVVAQELAQRPFSLIFPGRRLPQSAVPQWHPGVMRALSEKTTQTPDTALALSAMCHREKWQFEGTAAFEVLHRIGDMTTRVQERLSEELDPEIGAPTDDLLRRIHLDVETRGRKNPAFIVSVHHRNIVLSAVAHAIRKRDCSWEEWLEACGWPRASGDCECYRPGDCDGSCTHPAPPATGG